MGKDRDDYSEKKEFDLENNFKNLHVSINTDLD